MTSQNVITPEFQTNPPANLEDTWVLFVLEDIATYLRKAELPEAASTVEKTIQDIEYAVLTSQASKQCATGAGCQTCTVHHL